LGKTTNRKKEKVSPKRPGPGGPTYQTQAVKGAVQKKEWDSEKGKCNHTVDQRYLVDIPGLGILLKFCLSGKKWAEKEKLKKGRNRRGGGRGGGGGGGVVAGGRGGVVKAPCTTREGTGERKTSATLTQIEYY